jgi:hypothetical protein
MRPPTVQRVGGAKRQDADGTLPQAERDRNEDPAPQVLRKNPRLAQQQQETGNANPRHRESARGHGVQGAESKSHASIGAVGGRETNSVFAAATGREALSGLAESGRRR